MPETTHFVHLSDPHIVAPNASDDHLHSDTTATFERVKAQVATLQPQPDFIVISGDLTNKGTVENFTALKDLIADFQIPVLLALGNHDTRSTFYEVVSDQPELGDAPYYHAQVIKGLHVITLDSSVTGAVIGTLEPEQRTWLASELELHPESPKLIVVHHPPGELHQPIFETINWLPDDRAALGDLLEAAVKRGVKIVGILSGHVHYDQFSMWHGIPCIISAGLHNLTDSLVTDGLRATTGGGFNVCRVTAGELTAYTVQLPSDGTELYHMTNERMRQITAEYEASRAAVTKAPAIEAVPA
jgi:3',5'-cyclic-AMP phosphodiesterase